MSSTNTQEIALLEACLNGDRSAQNQLYSQYKVQMFRLCLRYANCPEEAEDMLQEGFFRVFTSLHQYSRKGALGGWIRKVILHTSISYLRRKKSKHMLKEDLSPVVNCPSEEADIISQFGSQDILGLIQRLPDGYRSIFNLYAIEGYSHKEIADKLNITESTSRSQYVRARNSLKKMFERLLII